MENEKSAVNNLFEKAGDYLETKAELVKLQAVEKSAELVSSAIASIVLILTGFLFIFMLDMALGFMFGDLLNKTSYGFFVMAGINLFAGLLIYGFRKKWLKAPIADSIIKKMLN
jgi:hypothetical protein